MEVDRIEIGPMVHDDRSSGVETVANHHDASRVGDPHMIARRAREVDAHVLVVRLAVEDADVTEMAGQSVRPRPFEAAVHHERLGLLAERTVDRSIVGDDSILVLLRWLYVDLLDLDRHLPEGEWRNFDALGDVDALFLGIRAIRELEVDR